MIQGNSNEESIVEENSQAENLNNEETEDKLNPSIELEEESEENQIDVAAVEEELYAKLEVSAAGELLDSFFGDFNDDGTYEIWAVYRESGEPEYDEYDDPGKGVWGEYKQLKVWYVDDAGADLIDEITTLIVTEEWANGETTYWHEDTFYQLISIDSEILQFGSLQQLAVQIDYTWMTGRGYGLYDYPELSLYGNDGEAALRMRDEIGDIGVRDNILCYKEYVQSTQESKMASDGDWWTYRYYPIVYSDGKYQEIVSVKIDYEQLSKISNFEEIYETAVGEEIVFYSNDMSGSASNVFDRHCRILTMEVDDVLYNNTGYIYINLYADAVETAWVSSMGGEVVDDISNLPICLELKLEGNEITEYRWVEGFQQTSMTEYEKINSVWNIG